MYINKEIVELSIRRRKSITGMFYRRLIVRTSMYLQKNGVNDLFTFLYGEFTKLNI